MYLRSNIRNTLAYFVYSMFLFFLSHACFAERMVQAKTYISKETLDQFSHYAERIRKDWHIPGMAIAIVQDGEIIYGLGFGKRNIKGNPATPNYINNNKST